VFDVESIAIGVDTLTLFVTNPNRSNDDWDELETGAECAVFTDSLTVLDSDVFIKGDQFLGQGIELLGLSVLKQNGTTLHVDQARDRTEIPGGLRVWAGRTLSVLPMHQFELPESPFVAGDSLSIGTSTSRVEAINTSDTLSLTLTGTSDDEEITASVSSTGNLKVGQAVLLTDATGIMDGEWQISDIPSNSSFKVTNKGIDAPATASLVGKTIELDATMTVDGEQLMVTRPLRWEPIETDGALIGRDQIFEGDSSDQSLVKSTMARDSLFATNGEDPVMRFDGSKMARAGLPRWDGLAFINADSGGDSEARIPVISVDVDFDSVRDNQFVIHNEDTYVFSVGDEISPDNENFFEISEIEPDPNSASHTLVKVKGNPSGIAGAGTLSTVSTFRYYVRLSYVDVNGGIVTGPAIGSEDFDVKLSDSAGVELVFHSLPLLDSYPENLELNVFRTKSNGNTFYRVTTIPITGGTTLFRDTTPDEALVEFDNVSTALEGVELGTQWDGPLRSSYVTSIDNRLILGNVKSWPTLDYRLLRTPEKKFVTAAEFDGTTFTLREDNTQAGGYEFEFTNQSTEETADGSGIISSVGGTPLVEGDIIYSFVSSRDSSLASSNYHVADSSGNITVEPNATVRIATASTTGTVPIYVCRQGDGEPDWNMPSLELFSAENDAVRKLAIGINWHQTTLAEAFVTASAGGAFAYGQLILKQPKVSETIFEGEWSGLDAGIQLFANDISRTSDEQVSAFTTLHPSRITISERNFPSLFTLPDAALDVSSGGVVDINADDGQAITGIASFFGDSTSGSAMKQDTLIVFKERSIYAVSTHDLSYQKLETEGRGCTVPQSIVSTKDGIVFANDTSIYRLSPSMQIAHIGFSYENVWRKQADDKTIGAATYWKFENSYLLSYASAVEAPLSPETVPTANGKEVAPVAQGDRLVSFNMNREEVSGVPSAVTHTGLDAVQFANWGVEGLMATKRGCVLRARISGEDTDHRDENRAIPALIRARALSFGQEGIRKMMGAIITPLTVGENVTHVSLSTRADLDGNFIETDTITVEQNEEGEEPTSYRIVSSSPATSRGAYLQCQWELTVVDGFLELSSYSVQVAGLSSHGQAQAGG
jgi:hypothetical protein